MSCRSCIHVTVPQVWTDRLGSRPVVQLRTPRVAACASPPLPSAPAFPGTKPEAASAPRMLRLVMTMASRDFPCKWLQHPPFWPSTCRMSLQLPLCVLAVNVFPLSPSLLHPPLPFCASWQSRWTSFPSCECNNKSIVIGIFLGNSF